MTDATFRNLTVNNELFLKQSNTTLSHLNERTLSFSRNREFHTTYIRSDNLEVTRAILSRTSVSAPLISATNIEVSDTLLVNGVPVRGIEGITILVSGNQTTFQRNGVSSSIRFRVFDQNDTATDMLFRGATSVLPGELNVPTRLFLSHPVGVQRHLFTSYISIIDAENVNEIQRARHHAIGNAYFIENMRDGGVISLRARLGPEGGSSNDMTTMIDSTTSLMRIFPDSTLENPSVLQIGARTHIDQIVPLMDGSSEGNGADVPTNILRRTLIRRTLLSDDQYHAGSTIPGMQVMDGGLFNRGMYINPNASQSSLNHIVQLNDVVLGGLGGASSSATKALSLTCWANMALGVRIWLENLNDITTGTVTMRANNTQLVVHSGSGYFFNASTGNLNSQRPLRFNSSTPTDRLIQNLTTLSMAHDAFTGPGSSSDMTMKVVNTTNSTNFTSNRNDMNFIFQTKNEAGSANRFVIGPTQVAVHRVNFRILSPSTESDQRQMVFRCDDGGNHRIQCTNAGSSGTGEFNHFLIALGRSDGSGGIIEEDVFTFRGGVSRHSSTKEIRLPGIQFSGDDSIQTTAFTSALNTQIANNLTSINTLNGVVADHSTSISTLQTTTSNHATAISDLQSAETSWQTQIDAKVNSLSPVLTGLITMDAHLINMRGIISFPQTNTYLRLETFDPIIQITQTELSYLNNVTSNIQSQFNAQQTLIDGVEADITTIEGQITTIQGATSTNTTNIAINTADITTIQGATSTNTTNIAINTADINSNTIAISNLQTAQTTFSGILNDHSSSLSQIGGISRLGGGEIPFQENVNVQTLHQITLTPGTYILNYTANLYTKQASFRNIRAWLTWFNTGGPFQIMSGIEWESSRIGSYEFSAPFEQLGPGHSHHGSSSIVITSTTTVDLLTILLYGDISNWNNDGFGGNGKWSYTKAYITATRIK